MLVGEQPGDQEDGRCRPFVGPAGRVLWSSVDGTRLERLSVTNAVNHLEHEVRGKRRLHKKPIIPTVVTDHLSAVLTADERSTEIREALVDDLRLLRDWVTS